MHDLVAMTITNSSKHLSHHPRRPILRHVGILPIVQYDIQQLATFTQFHHQIEVFLVLEKFENSYNMGMI
jgi:hypothetical protein